MSSSKPARRMHLARAAVSASICSAASAYMPIYISTLIRTQFGIDPLPLRGPFIRSPHPEQHLPYVVYHPHVPVNGYLTTSAFDNPGNILITHLHVPSSPPPLHRRRPIVQRLADEIALCLAYRQPPSSIPLPSTLLLVPTLECSLRYLASTSVALTGTSSSALPSST